MQTSCILAAVVAFLSVGQTPDGAVSTISGTVVNDRGQPVFDATVSLVATPPNQVTTLLAEGYTDLRGTFKLEGIRSSQLATDSAGRGPYLMARGPDQRLGLFPLTSARLYAGAHIRLQEVRDFQGKLTDRQGTPIAGARLTPWFLSPGGFRQNRLDVAELWPEIVAQLQTETKPDGSFVFKSLPTTGSLAVAVAAPTFSAPYLQFALSEPADLKLDREAILTGKATCAAEPLEASGVWVTVELRSSLPEHNMDRFRVIEQEYEQTSPTGRFEFDGLPPGRYTVGLNIDRVGKYYNLPVELTLLPGLEVNNLELPIKRSVLVRGLVVDRSTQTPVANATVVVDRVESQSYTPWNSGRTEEDGRFGLHAPPGVIHVRVTDPPPTHLPSNEGASTYTRVSAPADSAEVEYPQIELEPATALTGMVVDEAGRPVPQAEVWTINYNHYPPRLPSLTNPDGTFEVSKLNAAHGTRVRVRVHADKTTSDGTGLIDLKQATEVRLTVSKDNPCFIGGQALDVAGQPVEAADLWVRWHSRYPGVDTELQMNIEQSRIPKDGRFVSAELWPGDEFSVRVVATGYQSAESKRMTSEAGKTFDVGILRLKPVGTAQN